MSTCRVQSDSMQKTTCSFALGKKEKSRGGGDSKVENKCDFSCPPKEAMSFAWWSLSGGLFQRVGAGLWNDFAPNISYLCSHQIQRYSVCTGERGRRNRVDCMGKLVPVDTVMQSYGHIGMWDRGFYTQSIWRQAASALIVGHEWCVLKTLFWSQFLCAPFWIFCWWFKWLARMPHRVLLQ